MGKVIKFENKFLNEDYTSGQRFNKDIRKKAAQDLVYRAALLISDLGEKEQQIAWLLEDSADLLGERQGREFSSQEFNVAE